MKSRIRKIICAVILVISLIAVFFCLYIVTRGKDITEYTIKGLIALVVAVIADYIGGFGKDES